MFRTPLSVGIDIGSHSVKVVVINPRKDHLELFAFAEVAMPVKAISERHNISTEALLPVLRQLKKKLPSRAVHTVLALPDSAVISKVIQLDTNLSEDEAEFAVGQALSATSPFPLEELQLDFFPVTSSFAPQKMATTPYQVFAARKETISTRVAAVRKAGFKPKVMELQTHALLWLWQHLAKVLGQHNWALVDLGMRQTEFCICPGEVAGYHREIAFGCRDIAGLSPGDVPLQSGLDADTTLADPDVIDAFTLSFAEQLKRQVQLYSSTHSRYPLAGIWLCGGARTLVSEPLLTRILGLPVKWVNPFASLARSKRLPQYLASECYSQFVLATGLAMRGVVE